MALRISVEFDDNGDLVRISDDRGRAFHDDGPDNGLKGAVRIETMQFGFFEQAPQAFSGLMSIAATTERRVCVIHRGRHLCSG